jgi:hypothetical protein
MSKEDDDLRAVAAELVERRRRQTVEEETPESMPPHRHLVKTKRNAGELAKAAMVPGAGLVGVVALVQQLLSAHVSPEQLKALQERVDQIETDRTARRQTEYQRDLIENCRTEQVEGYVQSLLPRRDRQVGQPAQAWFDQCPKMPDATTGPKPAAK